MDKNELVGKKTEVLNAIKKKKTDLAISLLTEHPGYLNERVNSSNDSILHLCIRSRNLKLIEWLLENSVSRCLELPNHDGKRPLHEACLIGSLEIVQILLKKGCEVDALKRGDWTPLMLVAAKGHKEICQLLIQNGASLHFVNKDGWTAFHIACREGDPQLARIFLQIDKNSCMTRSANGRTPFHTAALHGNISILKLLFSFDAYPINDVDSCGNTPVMEATRSGKATGLKVLLSHLEPSELHRYDRMGRLPIHLASEAGKDDCVAILLEEFGIDVNVLSKNGQSSLHFAAKESQLSTVKILTKKGTHINLQDSKGRTALWLASTSKQKDCYKYLLEIGAADIADHQKVYPSEIIDRGI